MTTLSAEDFEALKEIKDIGKEISQTKERIEILDEKYKSKYELIEIRVKTHEFLDENIEKSLAKSRSKINVNAGGKIFQMSKDTILNTCYKNILQNEIRSNQNLEEVFVDCSPKCFRFISELIRLGNESYDNIIFSSVSEYYRTLFKNEPYLEYYVRMFFEDDSVKIFSEFNLPYSYFKTPLKENIADYQLFDSNNKQVDKHYSINEFSDLFEVNEKRIFNIPSKHYLVIEFSTDIRIQMIKLKPIIKKKALKEEGKVFSSKNGKDWTKIGKIPSRFTKKNIHHEIKFMTRTVRFIKFEVVEEISICSVQFL
jgi:hypothetical protein